MTYFLSIKKTGFKIKYNSILFSALLITISVIIFGVMIGLDRAWMPRWDQDQLGWSYGLVVLSGFFSWFSQIGLVAFNMMRRYELEDSQSMDSRIPIKRAPNV